jgi:hypothetical protein
MVRIDCGICTVVDSGTGHLLVDGFARGKLVFCVSDKGCLTLADIVGSESEGDSRWFFRVPFESVEAEEPSSVLGRASLLVDVEGCVTRCSGCSSA